MNSKGEKIDSHVEGLHSMNQGGHKMNASKTPAGKRFKSTPAGGQYPPGGAVHDRGLSGAVEHLYDEHPIDWNDLGPHHKDSTHERHESHPYGGKSAIR